jgi:type II secretory pathway pseudopilin PulG
MEFLRKKHSGQTSARRLRETGQTLIETLAALFILVMGVTAATGLAIFAFNSSTSILKQIVATGLAREGLEAVKNMRDTNWLQDTLSVNGCYNFETTANNDADCYVNWLGDHPLSSVPFCIDPTNSGSASNCSGNTSIKTYALGVDSAASDFWVWLRLTTNDYGLNFNSNISAGTGFYSPASGAVCDNSAGRSEYCRKIVLEKISSAPYNEDTGPLLKVQSMVWWVDKKCPRAADFNLAPVGCRVELVTYLSNWKNY